MPWQPLHRESPPEPIGASLDAVLRRLGGPSQRTVTDIFDAWPSVAGERVAQHCRPSKLDGSTLVVAVHDTAWASEIRWMTRDLLARIEDHTGSTDIIDIRVVVDRV